MRIVRGVLGLLAVLLVVLGAAWFLWLHNPHHDALRLDAAATLAGPGDLFIRDATLIDVEAGAALPGRSLLIEKGVIASVARAPAPPAGVPVLDAGGRYVLPGLVDVHAHLGTGGIAPAEPQTPLVVLEQYVRYGVTTVLVPGSSGASDEDIADLKAKAAAREIVSPTIFATGSLITVPGSHPISTILRIADDASVATLEAAGIEILEEDEDPEPILRRKAELGLDGVKIIVESGPSPVFGPNPRMSFETAARIVEIADGLGLSVYAHATSPDEFADAVRAGVSALIHSVDDGPIPADAEWITGLRDRRIPVAATLSIVDGFRVFVDAERLEDPELREAASPRTLRSMQNPLFRFFFGRAVTAGDLGEAQQVGFDNLRLLHEAGVPIALGTDTSMPFVFPGYSAHVEMELMSRAGLSNADVLRAATLGGAELLGAEDLGRLVPGSAADLLVLDANPLDDIRNTRRIHRVVLGGHPIADVP